MFRQKGMVIQGEAQLQAALIEAGASAIPALAAAGLEEMEMVMSEAKEVTPVDLGTLRDSGHVLPPDTSPTGVEIVAGFGGAASDYAIVQHERLDYSHATGGAKFLERPFLARVATMPLTLAAGVRVALSRLGV
jgi:hypothetical protein